MTLHTARFTTTGILVLLTGLIFLAELTSEFRLATWLPYFLLTIPASRLYPRHMYLFAVGGWSLLIAAGCLAPLPADEATNMLMSRTIGILGLWTITYQLARQPAACNLREVSRPTLPGSEHPQVQGPASQAPELVLPLVPAEPAAQKTRVLLVDDSIESHTLMRFYFRNTPYDLEIAPDGEQAVATFQTGRFDFVLIDLHLPGMDGFTATRTMRAWETSHKRPPATIVALTASSVADTQAQSLAVGCTDFLTKPITKAHLFNTLRKYRRFYPITDSTPAQATGPPHETERIDDEIRRRLPAFLANRRTDLTMMQEALVQGDYEAIRTTGHRMKGLAGSFGFPDIGAVGQRLEQAARSHDREAIRRDLDGLATILAGVDHAA
ncbi:MAG: response regulator [Nitrospira sp.]|nr:response regulator [Nitrospira sp.]